MNPGSAGAGYGYADMGPYEGGQAEFLRVPHGDFNCLTLPEDAEEKEHDYVMLADIFPTGYHATELAGVSPGESVVVYGAGPVGLLAAYSSILRGAGQVMVVDRHPDRLHLAERIGAVPIDDSKGSPVEQVLELTHEAYRHFDARDTGWTKVVLKPQDTVSSGRRRVSHAQTEASKRAEQSSRTH